jgi:hypothetical protein
MAKRRTAKTRSGKIVVLGTLTKIECGWLGYILHSNGFAVAIIIPE